MRRLRVVCKRREYTEAELDRMYAYWDRVFAENEQEAGQVQLLAKSIENEARQEAQTQPPPAARIAIAKASGTPTSWADFAALLKAGGCR